MTVKHVVVDGSNLATEGRALPSLQQLDEAVRAYLEQYKPVNVTVIVDASFPNRIDRRERAAYEDSVNAGELLTPPAGVIGRGDAFLLQIADRIDAVVLSNDSFQEFHGQFAWLFDQGRLIGGKPVPHVGWVFMERSPVRGPLSRRSVSDAKKAATTSARSKATAASPASPASPAKTTRSAGAAKTTGSTQAAKTARPTNAAGSGRATRRSDAARTTGAAPPKRTSAKKAEPARTAKAGTSRGARTTDAKSTATRGQPAAAKHAELAASAEPIAARRRRGSGGAVAPYNEALPFIEFVAAHPVGTEVQGEVERFTSHGAYVLVEGARCYLPLKNLAKPAPRSAREVLSFGQPYTFVVQAFDTPRRGVDLAMPGVTVASAAVRVLAVAAGDPVQPTEEERVAAARRKAPAKRKAAAKKAPARRKAATKKAPARKKAAAKRAPARKKATKRKAPAKRKVAKKKAPAKRKVAKKKAPAKRKAAAKRAPAKRKAAAKKAGAASARKAVKRKAAAKKAGAASARKAVKRRASARKAAKKR